MLLKALGHGHCVAPWLLQLPAPQTGKVENAMTHEDAGHYAAKHSEKTVRPDLAARLNKSSCFFSRGALRK